MSLYQPRDMSGKMAAKASLHLQIRKIVLKNDKLLKPRMNKTGLTRALRIFFRDTSFRLEKLVFL